MDEHNLEGIKTTNFNGRFQDGELTLFPGLTNLLYK